MNVPFAPDASEAAEGERSGCCCGSVLDCCAVCMFVMREFSAREPRALAKSSGAESLEAESDSGSDSDSDQMVLSPSSFSALLERRRSRRLWWLGIRRDGVVGPACRAPVGGIVLGVGAPAAEALPLSSARRAWCLAAEKAGSGSASRMPADSGGREARDGVAS